MNFENVVWHGQRNKLTGKDEPEMVRVKIALTEETNVLITWLADSRNGIANWRAIGVVENRGPKTTFQAITDAVQTLHNNTPVALTKMKGLYIAE